MTNQQIVELAKDRGFNADIGKGYNCDGVIGERAEISLSNRRPGQTEVFQVLGISTGMMDYAHGVVIYGSDS